MKILFLRSEQIALLGTAYALTQLGHDVIMPDARIRLETGGDVDKRSYNMVKTFLEMGHYDLVVTYDFSLAVSNACQLFQIPYYAYVYDDPLLTLYNKETLNEVNYISVFDKKQYERLSGMGLKHLFYMPLAACVEIFGVANIEKGDEDAYSCDMSFVGHLYNNRGFENIFDGDGEEYLQEACSVIEQMNCSWDKTTTIFDRASDGLISYMIAKESPKDWEIWNIDKRYFSESIRLARKCNEVERVRILKALHNKFSIVLYSDESAKKVLEDIAVRPEINYDTEMPKVFYLSKINLNISSRSIESGIPQRVWDIMASGGFCLTNYQPELEEYFELGKDLEVYHNLEELEEKTAYYLAHEEERIRIAINGYKKVRSEHDLKFRMQKMLDIIFGS